MSLKIKLNTTVVFPPLVLERKGRTKLVSRPNVRTPPGSKGALSCCSSKREREMHVAMVFVVSVLLNVELMQCQFVHKGPYQVVCGEVEDQSEEY